MRALLPLLGAITIALAGCGPFGGGEQTGLVVGTFDDVVKQPDPVAARELMRWVASDGFDAIRITAIWSRGQTEPAPDQLVPLRNAVRAADATDVRVFLSVYQGRSSDTPLVPESRAEFAHFAASLARSFPSVRDFIVGNEPNLNRFWMPQFGPDGSDTAAIAYTALLAATYDALKQVSPDIQVIGGVLAPRGADRPQSSRQTHAPATFIRDLGAAYRQTLRAEPIMDAFAFHPYAQRSSNPPDIVHPPDSDTIGLADYDRLVGLLGDAFDGTAQEGARLPIYYTEFGVETTVPPEKAALYEGQEPPTTQPVDPGTQARYYRRALELASCQRNVKGIFLFHDLDEQLLPGWQSGVRYADGTPKPSRDEVKQAAEAARSGKLTDCSD